MVRCGAYQQRRKLHCVIEGLLPAVVLEELVGIRGVPAQQASAMLGTASPALLLLPQCTAASPAGAPSDNCAPLDVHAAVLRGQSVHEAAAVL